MRGMKRGFPWFEAAVTALVLLCLWLSARLFVTLSSAGATSDRAEETLAASRAARAACAYLLADAPAEGEVPDEDARIEAALADAGYLWDEIPLDYELQDVLRTACAEFDVPVALALGLIETESRFDPEADNGQCYGLCQLNRDYFPDGLAPAENIRAGLEYLGDLLDRYDTAEAALTAYNAGHDTGARGYARAVLAAAERWEEVLDRGQDD